MVAQGRKAQTALALAFIFAAIIVILIFTSIGQKGHSTQQERNQQELRALDDLVTREVAVAKEVHEGAQWTVTLPKDIGEEPYTLSLRDGDEMTIMVGDRNRHTFFLPTKVYLRSKTGELTQAGEITGNFTVTVSSDGIILS